MDRHIDFRAEQVRALIDGRKTMDRRLAVAACKLCGSKGGTCNGPHRPSPWQKVKPGDRLYVRESFAILPRNCYALPKTQAPDPDMAAYYMADFDRSGKPGWNSSIHLPRWASRLTLIVEAVKIERLQDISEEDAKAEGIARNPVQQDTWIDYPEGTSAAGWASPVESFRSLWQSLHGHASWTANSEVAALTFRVVKGNIDDRKETQT